ncbi:MAG: peptide chain release factor 2 [Alphaproteobacteria bacterium]|nr:peptide chain release factor 2 [Alphaproteobacteria bacterium]
MYEQITTELKPLAERIDTLRGHLDIEGKTRKVADLESQSATPGFWDDNERAQRILKEKGQIERIVKDWQGLAELRDDITTLVELATEAADDDTAAEAQKQLEILDDRIRALETRRLLSAEEDHMDAILEINAGAGGTDAADWAEILLRMYGRWAERQGFSTELLYHAPSEEAGIRGATLAIRGPYAFGYLQAESGVHRLVRISPFDQNARRHTAFAAVAAYPEIDDTIEIDLNPADIEMETMRASGAGGQHVNTTDSAVRLRHLPTGIVVLCRAERSQHKNRDKAMKMLKAKLYQRELEKRQEAQDAVNAQKKKIDFGSQIRSYVMQPYQQVKDLRTNLAIGNVSEVLDGDITRFMESWLAARAEGTLQSGG